MEVLWTNKAIENLDAIAEHIAKVHLDAAVRMIGAIHKAVERLSSFPDSGRQTSIEGVRELVVSSLILRYSKTPHTIVILRVFHARQHRL